MTPDEFYSAKTDPQPRKRLRALSGVHAGRGIAPTPHGTNGLRTLHLPVGRIRPQRHPGPAAAVLGTANDFVANEKHHRLPLPNIDRPLEIFTP